MNQIEISLDDFDVECPMSNENVSKYGLTDSQVRRFCNDGCSSECKSEFRSKFILKQRLHK